MPDLKLLKSQHQELADLCKRIQAQLDLSEPQGDYICALLSTLAIKLQNHLALEDSGLYPFLKQHAGPKGRRLQESLNEEMACLRKAVEEYLDQWHSKERIAGDLDGFRQASSFILEALVRRIEHEAMEVFPLIENKQG